MDLRMPVMNGYEAIERLKTDPITRDMPIIAVTAQAMGEDRERCFQAGADGYVTKPIDRKFLTREVGRLLSKIP
jgi:CheY-like chemotaxis protein